MLYVSAAMNGRSCMVTAALNRASRTGHGAAGSKLANDAKREFGKLA